METMTKTEIFLALDLIRNTIITSHVALNQAMDQVEKLKAEVQKDIGIEAGRPEGKP